MRRWLIKILFYKLIYSIYSSIIQIGSESLKSSVVEIIAVIALLHF